MEILDRKNAPEIKTIEKIDLIQAKETKLDNGISVYSIEAGTQEVTKIEFVFDAGLWYQSLPLIAGATNAMLNEGTKLFSAQQIAEKIDRYGSFIQMEVEKDEASIVLFSLNKHLEKTLPVINDILRNSIFPQKEFEIFITNGKQRFRINNEKLSIVASKKFNELLFGNTNPYGYNVEENDYNKINPSQLISFHQDNYLRRPFKIIVSGKLPYNIFKLLNDWFGNDFFNSFDKKKIVSHKISPHPELKHYIEKKDAIQSVIKIGRILFNKCHSDYIGLHILNTFLGGYFGSRLMANIREDKGYTYGIGSGIVSNKNSGCFYISTEVGVDVCSKAIDEIYFELNRLQKELIPFDELNLVKNYLLGEFLRDIDGPFALAEKFKGILSYSLSYDYYHNYLNKIKHITSEELLQLAQKYFKQEDMTELVVGKK